MTNEITQQKYNEDGNLITAECRSGGITTQTIKFGYIKLMGEKTERRVSFKTICAIEESRKAGFDGNISITELGMSVQIKQIVMMRSEIETKTKMENFTSLLCESLIMDSDENGNLYPSKKNRQQHARDNEPYWQCVVHYRLEKGEKIYLTQFDKIKRAVHIFFEDGYEIAKEIYEYGVEKSQ